MQLRNQREGEGEKVLAAAFADAWFQSVATAWIDNQRGDRVTWLWRCQTTITRESERRTSNLAGHRQSLGLLSGLSPLTGVQFPHVRMSIAARGYRRTRRRTALQPVTQAKTLGFSTTFPNPEGPSPGALFAPLEVERLGLQSPECLRKRSLHHCEVTWMTIRKAFRDAVKGACGRYKSAPQYKLIKGEGKITRKGVCKGLCFVYSGLCNAEGTHFFDALEHSWSALLETAMKWQLILDIYVGGQDVHSAIGKTYEKNAPAVGLKLGESDYGTWAGAGELCDWLCDHTGFTQIWLPTHVLCTWVEGNAHFEFYEPNAGAGKTDSDNTFRKMLLYYFTNSEVTHKYKLKGKDVHVFQLLPLPPSGKPSLMLPIAWKYNVKGL